MAFDNDKGMAIGLRANGGPDPAALNQPRFRHTQANERAFAGRIGGNQEFAVDTTDEENRSLLKKTPDAAQITALRDSLSLDGFLVLDIWKMALIEGVGTCIFVFAIGAVSSGLTTVDVAPTTIAFYAFLSNWIGLSLFIYTFAPASGGHLNPSITVATFFAGLSTLPRTVLYVVAQCTGAIVGGYWLRLGLGDEDYFPKGVIPGCTVDPALVSRGQLFVLEYFFSLVQVFTAFGVGLDPRNARVYGPAYAPALVGMTLGFATLASTFIKPGYSGQSFNSARCLGLMTAKGNLQYHYVHWLAATLAATMVNGVFYFIAPPYKRGKPLRDTPMHPDVDA